MQKIEPGSFEDLFARRLHRYDADKSSLADERTEQDELAARVKEANTAFRNARKGDSSSREREQALQQLEGCYLKYREIVSNLDVGRKFYNDLAKIVGRFRDESREFAHGRRVEAAHIERCAPACVHRHLPRL